jgi:hypothetical protein
LGVEGRVAGLEGGGGKVRESWACLGVGLFDGGVG